MSSRKHTARCFAPSCEKDIRKYSVLDPEQASSWDKTENVSGEIEQRFKQSSARAIPGYPPSQPKTCELYTDVQCGLTIGLAGSDPEAGG